MPNNSSLLLVEDNEDDAFIMKRALRAAGIKNLLRVVEDGQEAIQYLNGEGAFHDREQFPIPALMFLDLNMPLKSGFDVLAWVRARSEFDSMVAVVLTSSNEPRDISRAYALGANSYLVKPPTPDQLLDMARAFKWYWLEYNQFEQPRPA